MNLLRSILGTGIYAMPLAFSYTGLVTGVFSTAATALIYTHCVNILLRSTQNLCQKTQKISLRYPEVAEMACIYGK